MNPHRALPTYAVTTQPQELTVTMFYVCFAEAVYSTMARPKTERTEYHRSLLSCGLLQLKVGMPRSKARHSAGFKAHQPVTEFVACMFFLSSCKSYGLQQCPMLDAYNFLLAAHRRRTKVLTPLEHYPNCGAHGDPPTPLGMLFLDPTSSKTLSSGIRRKLS